MAQALKYLALPFLIGQFALGTIIGVVFLAVFNPTAFDRADWLIRALLHAGLIGLVTGITSRIFEMEVAPRLARWPIVVEIIVWSLMMEVAIGVSFLGGLAVLHPPSEVMAALPIVPIMILYIFIAASMVGFGVRLIRLIGRNVLVGLISGRYLRPKQEERIILFLDLTGSTALAERLGESRLHEMIAQFFSDIDGAISGSGGEVMSYLGDGVIVVWKTGTPERNGRAVAGLVAARKAIARVAARYERQFGATPQFRAGLHLGFVSVGEVGGVRRQISLFGDPMNVAARLQDEAKAIESGWIASEAYVRATRMPAGVDVAPLGDLSLRGRSAPVAAYALSVA